MSALTILTKEKLTDCIHLYIDVFNSPPWNETWTVESASERLSDLLSTPKFRGYTQHIDGKPAGFIAGNAKRTSKGMTFYIAGFASTHPSKEKELDPRSSLTWKRN